VQAAQQVLARRQRLQARFDLEASSRAAARTPCWDQACALSQPEEESEPAAVPELRSVQASVLERVPVW
jgi:hypothetical protein